MGFITLKGNRESLNQNSESFKSKIIEYMTQKGYILTGDSANDGTFTDLIFKRPLIEGVKETRVESKFTELSLKDKDFLHGLGIYFNIFSQTNCKFNLFIFVKKCKNPVQWKQIFDDAKSNQKEVQKLRDSILKHLEGDEKQTFLSKDASEFNLFVSEITLIQGDYPSILQSIDEMKKTEKFNVNKKLLDENYEISKKSEIITSNILKVTKLPEYVWTAEIKSNFIQDELSNMALDKQIFVSNNQVFSLRELDKDKELLGYIKNINKIKIIELPVEISKKINIIKVLIKYNVINKGRKIGLAYDPIFDILYFKYKGSGYADKYKGRRLLKPYFDLQKKIINFVKHDGISIYVKYYTENYYISLAQKIIFTKDGKNDVIRGDSSSALHHKFTQRFTYNNTEKSKLLYWIDIFQFKDRSLCVEDNFFVSEPLIIKSPITFLGGERFDTDLLDFFNGDKEDESKI